MSCHSGHHAWPRGAGRETRQSPSIQQEHGSSRPVRKKKHILDRESSCRRLNTTHFDTCVVSVERRLQVECGGVALTHRFYFVAAAF